MPAQIPHLAHPEMDKLSGNTLKMTDVIFESLLSLKITFSVKKKREEKQAFRARLLTNKMLGENDRNDSRLLRVKVPNPSAAAVNLSHRQVVFEINIVLDKHKSQINLHIYYSTVSI